MDYRVEELARAAGLRVDTIRFYQARGLLPPPRRCGRVVFYSPDHLTRLRRIRALNRQGLKLEAVGRVLAAECGPAGDGDGAARPRTGETPQASERPEGVRRSLLEALERSAEPDARARGWSRAQLEAELGIPGFLIDALEQVGLIGTPPSSDAGAARYGAGDRGALASARALLDAGLPFAEMLDLAREHAAHVERMAERSVSLFERALARRPERPEPHAIAQTLEQLLPAAGQLVARHFERTLVARARERLLERGGAADSPSAARPGGAK